MAGERILVLGCPGSGKTVFARMLAARMQLPLHHLDDLYWRAGWRRPSPEDWRSELRTVLQQPRWIMDGNFHQSLGQRLAGG